MATATKKTGMESIVILGELTTTSNKQSEEFTSEVKSKTGYFEITDEKEIAKALEFGLKKYTSKEDGNDFFICKLAQNIRIYDGLGGKTPIMEQPATIEDVNFKTSGPMQLAFIKGQKNKNEFIRLSAIKVVDETNIELIEAENPFA